MDFFICYNKADKDWADWVGWHLENIGYKVWMPDWDISAGNNEVIAIQKALEDAKNKSIERRMILILTPNFSNATTQEVAWASIHNQDPDGSKGLLIPVIVSQNTLNNIVPTSIKPIDLSQTNDEEYAVQHLLTGISKERQKPLVKPDFPGSQSESSRPAYPGNVATQTKLTASSNKQKAAHPPAYKLGLVDRRLQLDHFSSNIPKEYCLRNSKTMGFILSGPRQEWPQAIRYKLSYLLEVDLGRNKRSPELIRLHDEKSMVNKEPALYLWELLASTIECDAEKISIQERLKQLEACHIFYRELPSEESKNQKFLADMFLAWSQIELNSGSTSHFLLLICESDYLERHAWLPFSKKPQQWRSKMEKELKENDLAESLLPPLHSPSRTEDMEDWMIHHVEESHRDDIRKILKKECSRSSNIPLAHLKKILLPIMQDY